MPVRRTTEQTTQPEQVVQPAPAPEQVPSDATPLAAPEPEPEGAWALLNLLAAALTCLASVFRLAGLRSDGESDESEDEETRRNRRAMRVVTLVPAVGSVVAFLLTEDMSQPMALLDAWTPMMGAILLVQAVIVWLASNKDEEQDERQA